MLRRHHRVRLLSIEVLRIGVGVGIWLEWSSMDGSLGNLRQRSASRVLSWVGRLAGMRLLRVAIGNLEGNLLMECLLVWLGLLHERR